MVKKQTVFLGLLVLALMLCVSVVGAQDNTVVGSEHSVFSVRLPQGYVSKPLPIPNFSDVVAFGSSSGALSFIEGVIAGQQGSGSDTGVGGFIGQLDLSRATAAQTPASLAPQLMQVMIQAIAGNNVQFIQQTAPHTFGGQYNGLLALTQAGYIGVINTDKELFLIVVLTDNLSTNQTTMNAIMDSIRVPPESASQQPTPVTQLQPTTEGAATATAVESLTVRSSDQRVSLDVPADWTVMDRIADQNTLVYGNSPEAEGSDQWQRRSGYSLPGSTV